MGNLIDWWNHIDWNNPEWVGAMVALATMIGGLILWIYCQVRKMFRAINASKETTAPSQAETTTTETFSPISNKEIDDMFPTVAQPVKEAKWRVDIDESNYRFVLTNIGNGLARNITVTVRADAKEGTYTKKWPAIDKITRMTPADNEGLEDFGFFRDTLPVLRETRQRGGTEFLDGHIEDGDGKAHYPVKFDITWLDDAGEVQQQSITVTVN